jgi:hypothetical protein
VSEPLIIEIGTAKCIYEPRGEHGLEGYQCGEIYKYEYKETEHLRRYYKIFPNDALCPTYGENVGRNSFKKYFEIVTRTMFL